MRVQLVHPPVYVNVRALTALRPGLPLGLAYVAAVLEKARHQVSVLDAVGAAPDRVTPDGAMHRLGLTPEELVARLDPAAEAIGVTNMWSFSWPLVRELIQRIRAARPGVPIVAGGEHFTGLTRESMEQAPIDYVVRGEGEETAAQLFAGLARGDLDPATIPGLAWRRGGEIVINEPRERTRAVDEIPWPAWHLFDVRGYYDHALITGLDAGLTIPILATRGCPYSCTYCSSPRMWTTRWVPRDPLDVVSEIERYVRDFGARNFPFQDLTAIIKKDWIVRFCRELLARRLDVTWQFPSGTRCEVIDDEVAGLLAASGGRSLAFAPESGSAETRAKVKKRMTEEGLLDAVRASVRHGLNLTVFVVIGFPHDTAADLAETLRLAKVLAKLGVDDLAIGFFFPIPSTELYDQLVASAASRSPTSS
ncbi:MAG: B12-binding domain-containing radical SAM protein [Deltaproteobacteria bacterium]|nr:B12-binding domain-containing radical SAM protein [Deltaproteobacteria bacterium]